MTFNPPGFGLGDFLANNLTISLTYGAGTNGVIKTKQMLGRLLELYAVGLKSRREIG